MDFSFPADILCRWNGLCLNVLAMSEPLKRKQQKQNKRMYSVYNNVHPIHSLCGKHWTANIRQDLK